MANNIRVGWKSVETYVLGIAGTLGVFIPGFPQQIETIGPILVWALGRLAEKILGPAAPDARSWQTPEFYVGILGVIVAAVSKTLPPSPENAYGSIVSTVFFGAIIIGIVAVRLFRNHNVTKEVTP
jgi:hypothetical protein